MSKDAAAAGVQQPVIRDDVCGRPLRCVCGGTGGGDVRLVRMRVDGKATLYHQRPVPLCVTCRRAERGRWMYVDRAG
jgi:hypothetical protein